MPIELDLYNVIYLTFRLFPIILPTYFVLSSLFSQDFKGIIYLAGLLFASFISLLMGNSIENQYQGSIISSNPDEKCKLITLNGASPVSKVPLSQAVYAYTFAYICTIIQLHSDKNNNLWVQNIATVLFLGILIVSDMIWNYTNQCNTGVGIGVSFLTSGVFGLLWAWMIDRSGAVKLQYFNGLSNRTYCSRPSTQVFKCSNKK
jgi:hypothetical protein